MPGVVELLDALDDLAGIPYCRGLQLRPRLPAPRARRDGPARPPRGPGLQRRRRRARQARAGPVPARGAADGRDPVPLRRRGGQPVRRRRRPSRPGWPATRTPVASPRSTGSRVSERCCSTTWPSSVAVLTGRTPVLAHVPDAGAVGRERGPVGRATPQILTIGDNVVDQYPDLGIMFPGGNAVNVAVHARRCGAESAYLGVLGTDGNGDVVRRSLEAEGVGTRYLRTVPGPNAFAVVRVVDGDRFFESGEVGVSRIDLREEDLRAVATGGRRAHRRVLDGRGRPAAHRRGGTGAVVRLLRASLGVRRDVRPLRRHRRGLGPRRRVRRGRGRCPGGPPRADDGRGDPGSPRRHRARRRRDPPRTGRPGRRRRHPRSRRRLHRPADRRHRALGAVGRAAARRPRPTPRRRAPTTVPTGTRHLWPADRWTDHQASAR